MFADEREPSFLRSLTEEQRKKVRADLIAGACINTIIAWVFYRLPDEAEYQEARFIVDHLRYQLEEEGAIE